MLDLFLHHMFQHNNQMTNHDWKNHSTQFCMIGSIVSFHTGNTEHSRRTWFNPRHHEPKHSQRACFGVRGIRPDKSMDLPSHQGHKPRLDCTMLMAVVATMPKYFESHFPLLVKLTVGNPSVLVFSVRLVDKFNKHPVLNLPWSLPSRSRCVWPLVVVQFGRVVDGGFGVGVEELVAWSLSAGFT